MQTLSPSYPQLGETALHHGSRAGQTAAVQLLLDHGTNVHAETEMVGVVFVLVYYFMPRAPYSVLEQPSTLCCLCNSYMYYMPTRDASDSLHEAQGLSWRAECNKDRYGNDGLM